MTEDRTVWLDDHQQRVWRLWLEVTTALPAVLNRQLSRDSQLSVQDFEVLVRLSETDDEEMRVVALSEHMGWERSRLSHHLTRMEKRGLVERRICCSDSHHPPHRSGEDSAAAGRSRSCGLGASGCLRWFGSWSSQRPGDHSQPHLRRPHRGGEEPAGRPRMTAADVSSQSCPVPPTETAISRQSTRP